MAYVQSTPSGVEYILGNHLLNSLGGASVFYHLIYFVLRAMYDCLSSECPISRSSVLSSQASGRCAALQYPWLIVSAIRESERSGTI